MTFWAGKYSVIKSLAGRYSYLQCLTLLHSVFGVLPTLHDVVVNQQYILQTLIYTEEKYNRLSVLYRLARFNFFQVTSTDLNKSKCFDLDF